MSWVRLHDGALTHPKIVGIFDARRPFELWIWGLSYSQAHLTDGLLPSEAIPKGVEKAVQVLLARGLWQTVDNGYTIHDFLEWNNSKELVRKKQTDARARMRSVRANNSNEPTANISQRTSLRDVPIGLVRSCISLEKEDESFAMRAGELLQNYEALFCKHRRGARYHKRETLDFPKAFELVHTWTDDARLEKLAVLILTTDDEWIANTDRGFGIFAVKASWADDKLAAWEAANGQKVTAK